MTPELGMSLIWRRKKRPMAYVASRGPMLIHLGNGWVLGNGDGMHAFTSPQAREHWLKNKRDEWPEYDIRLVPSNE